MARLLKQKQKKCGFPNKATSKTLSNKYLRFQGGSGYVCVDYRGATAPKNINLFF